MLIEQQERAFLYWFVRWHYINVLQNFGRLTLNQLARRLNVILQICALAKVNNQELVGNVLEDKFVINDEVMIKPSYLES